MKNNNIKHGWICPRCGTAVSDNEQICPNCKMGRKDQQFESIYNGNNKMICD